jgi:hypothetical protein
MSAWSAPKNQYIQLTKQDAVSQKRMTSSTYTCMQKVSTKHTL